MPEGDRTYDVNMLEIFWDGKSIDPNLSGVNLIIPSDTPDSKMGCGGRDKLLIALNQKSLRSLPCGECAVSRVCTFG